MNDAEPDVTNARERAPDEAAECEAAYEAYLRDKVGGSLRELDQGNAISHGEIKKRLRRYLR
jgi:hypothetical protein